MTGGALQYLLLMCACLSLIGLGLSGVMVSRAQSDNDRRTKRLASILAPHLRSTQIELSAFTVPDESDARSRATIYASIFGFDLERQALYPAKWYVVLAITFLLAIAGRYATDDLLGPLSWLTLPVIWIMASRMFFKRVEGKRRGALLWQFPDALAMIVRAIRVGVPVIGLIKCEYEGYAPYITPTLVEVSGVPLRWAPAVLACFGAGMIIGNIVGPHFADRGVTPTIFGAIVWNVVILALFSVAVHWAWTAVPFVLLIGAGFAAAPALQTRLMDVGREAQPLAAALNHSALNIANAFGAWLGGVAISGGYGYASTGWIGALLALAGLAVFAAAVAIERRSAVAYIA